MFLYKNLFFSISILSIPIMLIEINGGYFPAICGVCFLFCFNPDMRLARQRWLFSGNLPAMFSFWTIFCELFSILDCLVQYCFVRTRWVHTKILILNCFSLHLNLSEPGGGGGSVIDFYNFENGAGKL